MRKLVVLLLYAFYLPVTAQYTADPYLEMAAANNPELKAKFNDFMVSLEMIPQAKGIDDPKVIFGYFVQPIETRVGAQQATLGLSQTFPWFGTLKAKESVACQLAEAKLVAFENAKLQLYRDVRLAYGELYYLEKAVKLTKENLQLLGSFKELARVNFESGKTGFTSVLRVQMEEEELKANLDFLEDHKNTAQAAFRNLLNVSQEQEILIADSMPVVSLTLRKHQLSDTMRSGNLQIRELEFRTQAMDEQVEVARRMAKPTFSVGLNYTFVNERTDMELPDNGKNALLIPQVGMSVPIFQKKYKAMENQAVLEKERIQYEIENRTNQLSTELEHLVTEHQDGQRRITLYTQLHTLAERSLSLLQTEFTTGRTDFEEVLRMERKILTYLLAMERARVDINNAVYKINYLMGNEKF